MATREYYIGKQKCTIEEIDEVVAVRMAPPDFRAAPPAIASLGTPAARMPRGRPARDAIPGDVASAFARANWHFIVPDPGVRGGAAALGANPVVSDLAHVFKRADGSVVVATSALTVQLRPDLSEDAAEAVLRERNLEPVRRCALRATPTRSTRMGGRIR